MEYQWFEDSDVDEESEWDTSHVKEEPEAVENRMSTMTLSSEEEDGEQTDGEENGDESIDDEAFKEVSEHEFLKLDVKIAAKTWPELEREQCIPSVQIERSLSGKDEMCSVILTLDVTTLPDIIRSMWELGSAMTVSVILDGIHKGRYREYDYRPIVLARMDSDKPSKFPVGECLMNVIKPLVTETYTLTKNCSPKENGSFFLMLYDQLVERMRRLPEFCMVCLQKLYKRGLLPSICEGELCQYQYQELGVLDGLTTPRVSAPVLSLLLMAFNAAVSSQRRNDILTPAPSIGDTNQLMEEVKLLYEKIDEMWNSSEEGLDVHKMLGCAMPCASKILLSPSNYQEFKKATPRVAQFIDWLVTSNQSYLELVPKPIDYLKTPHQFLFVADSPQKQAEFDGLVNRNGGRTRYLFHGSKTENWHSIIRNGLKNMSGTKYQQVGAYYGNGIYLSNLLALSYRYCTPFQAANVSQNCVNNNCCMSTRVKDGGMMLLAVVEVVDTPDAYPRSYPRTPPPDIVVVADEKWCSIRMLVAYTGNVPAIDLNQMNAESRKQIQEVAQMYKTADIVERVKHVADESSLLSNNSF